MRILFAYYNNAAQIPRQISQKYAPVAKKWRAEFLPVTVYRIVFPDQMFSPDIYAALSDAESPRKSSEMHHAAESATMIYTIRLRTAPCPPNIHATRSKLNIPTRPQLSPPMISSTSASLSIHISDPPFTFSYAELSAVIIMWIFRRIM